MRNSQTTRNVKNGADMLPIMLTVQWMVIIYILSPGSGGNMKP